MSGTFWTLLETSESGYILLVSSGSLRGFPLSWTPNIIQHQKIREESNLCRAGGSDLDLESQGCGPWHRVLGDDHILLRFIKYRI